VPAVLQRALAPDPRLEPRARAACAGHLRCDLNGFRLPEFAAGCRLGAVVLAVVVVAAWAARHVRRGPGRAAPLPIGGVLVAAAFVEAMRETGRLVPGMAVGLALLVGGGALAAVATQRAAPPTALTEGGGQPAGQPAAGRALAAPHLALLALLSVPGAWVLAVHAGLGNPGWARAVVAGAVFVGAPLTADLDSRGRLDGLGPVLLAVSVIGVFFTVPDTDVALALMPITVLLALGAWPLPLVTLGPGGPAAVGALAWVAAVGGVGRGSAVVGGVASLGLLVAEPLGRLLARRPRGALGGHRHTPRYAAAVAAIQLLVVYVASRVAGTQLTVRRAVPIAALDLAVATIVAASVARSRPRRAHSVGMPYRRQARGRGGGDGTPLRQERARRR
jgi:hypothetical protein